MGYQYRHIKGWIIVIICALSDPLQLRVVQGMWEEWGAREGGRAGARGGGDAQCKFRGVAARGKLRAHGPGSLPTTVKRAESEIIRRDAHPLPRRPSPPPVGCTPRAVQPRAPPLLAAAPRACRQRRRCDLEISLSFVRSLVGRERCGQHVQRAYLSSVAIHSNYLLLLSFTSHISVRRFFIILVSGQPH